MAGRSRMWQPKDLLLAVVTALCVPACTAAGEPLVMAITKDAATSLYTAPLKSGRPLLLDLSGPIVWSTCPAAHTTLDCNSVACMRAHRYHPPSCPHTGYGRPDADNPYRCKCVAHPHNPVSAVTAPSGDVTRATLSANATDGRNPLRPASFVAVTSCAPDSLLARLPAGAVGVAGLARSGLSFPSQVAAKQKVRNTFALCLPRAGTGVAVFGGGPLFLMSPERPAITAMLAGDTPLRKYRESPGYFVAANKVGVNQARVPLSDNAPLTIGLSSTIRYTELRADVYRSFIRAFDQAMGQRVRVATPPPAAPFELCYDSSKLSATRLGYFVPQVDLMLDGGKNWTVFGGNSMAQVDRHTACFAFLEMKEGKKGYGGRAAPAVLIGGFQMEDNLVVFDEEKQRLGFSGLLTGRGFSCSNFNFTMPA